MNLLRINVLKGFSFWQEKATGYADGGEDALCQHLGEAGFAVCKNRAGTTWPRHDFLILLQVCVGSFYKFGIYKPCFILANKKCPFALHR